ncbi:MAG: hypothetical protein VW338_05550 [Rhodospirillaceae bacterium]
MPAVIQRLLCFAAVTLGWPLFYLDLAAYGELLGVLLAPKTWWFGVYHPLTEVPLVLGLTAVTLFPGLILTPLRRLAERGLALAPVQVGLVVVAVMFFHITQTFIYFRF